MLRVDKWKECDSLTVQSIGIILVEKHIKFYIFDMSLKKEMRKKKSKSAGALQQAGIVCFLRHQQHFTYFEKQLVGRTRPRTEVLNKQWLWENSKQNWFKNTDCMLMLKESYNVGIFVGWRITIYQSKCSIFSHCLFPVKWLNYTVLYIL